MWNFDYTDESLSLLLLLIAAAATRSYVCSSSAAGGKMLHKKTTRGLGTREGTSDVLYNMSAAADRLKLF